MNRMSSFFGSIGKSMRRVTGRRSRSRSRNKNQTTSVLHNVHNVEIPILDPKNYRNHSAHGNVIAAKANARISKKRENSLQKRLEKTAQKKAKVSIAKKELNKNKSTKYASAKLNRSISRAKKSENNAVKRANEAKKRAVKSALKAHKSVLKGTNV